MTTARRDRMSPAQRLGALLVTIAVMLAAVTP
jgi:hypothetical protein